MSKSAKTVWDIPEDFQWGDRFESFSPDELRRLETYHELARDMGERPFFSSSVKMSFKASPEESYQHLEHAGDDALRSVSMTFRQMWSDQPTRVEGVHQLLYDHAKRGSADGVDVRALLSSIIRRYNAAKSEEMMKHVWEHDPFGEPKASFSAEYVIDQWFYSGTRFHWDDDKQAFVESWSREAIEFSYIKAMQNVAGVMWELDVMVAGALEEAGVLAA